MPDRASAQVNPTVTGPVYQPLLPTAPAVTAPSMLGAVSSSLTSTPADPALPALSSAWPKIHSLAVSMETRTSGVTLSSLTLEPVSVARKLTVTSWRFSPPAFWLRGGGGGGARG